MRTATPAGPKNLQLLTIIDAARELGITPETLRVWARKLPDFPKPVTINGRPYLKADELAKWIDAQPRGGDDE